MTDVERPHSPLSLRVAGVVVLVVLGWFLFGTALHGVRVVIGLAGYLMVAIGAYHVGKWVGRKHHDAP